MAEESGIELGFGIWVVMLPFIVMTLIKLIISIVSVVKLKFRVKRASELIKRIKEKLPE